MDPAGQDARLRRRAVSRGAEDRADVDLVRSQRTEKPAPCFVPPGDAGQARGAPERRDVARGIAGASRHDFGRVVVENQDRRFTRDARDLAVNELVGDQVSGDDDPAPRERVNQREQASSLARTLHACCRIHAAASIRLSTTAAGTVPA